MKNNYKNHFSYMCAQEAYNRQNFGALSDEAIKEVDIWLCKNIPFPDTSTELSRWRVLLERMKPNLAEEIYNSYKNER